MDWINEDKKLIALEDSVKIPDNKLSDVDNLTLKNIDDLDKIQNTGGCYWIWTNEPIKHSFHNKIMPLKLNNGEIIYNGVATEKIRDRIKKHLFSCVDERMSGISVDILLSTYNGSHRKKALSLTGKPAYFNGKRIRIKKDLLSINLTNEEKEFVIKEEESIFFRNGINVSETKHINFTYKVYYIVGLKSYSYADIIEKKWRKLHGIPRLCTYSKGR